MPPARRRRITPRTAPSSRNRQVRRRAEAGQRSRGRRAATAARSVQTARVRQLARSGNRATGTRNRLNQLIPLDLNLCRRAPRSLNNRNVAASRLYLRNAREVRSPLFLSFSRDFQSESDDETLSEEEPLNEVDLLGRALPSPDGVDEATNSVSLRRLQRELEQFTTNPPPFCTGALVDDDMYRWRCTMEGPPNTPYEDGVFNIDIQIPLNYPFRPPLITFLTKIYHCNINRVGVVCIDILGENWSPALSISTVLISITSLLTDCNPHDPLDARVAAHYLSNREGHDRVARIWTRRYARKDADRADEREKR